MLTRPTSAAHPSSFLPEQPQPQLHKQSGPKRPAGENWTDDPQLDGRSKRGTSPLAGLVNLAATPVA
jgi:hypothetical protein